VFDTIIEAEEGDLIMFPGYLMHSTEKNMSNENRIILGFNIRWDLIQ
jgi:ectoine hydroxylase-related dioxygenase (phytanoyl-CoA dioxygenase family)